jgi:hypothetical protein
MEKTLKNGLNLFVVGWALLSVPALAADEQKEGAPATVAKEEAAKEESAPQEPIKNEYAEEKAKEEALRAENEEGAKSALKPATYSPEHCEFTVSFPDEPVIDSTCQGEGTNRCYDQVSFMHTFDMQATVSFRVICNKIDEHIYKHYSAAVMEGTLKEMTKKTTVKTFDTSYREEKGYKQAGLVGEGQMGRSATIYLAQLWIGSQSAMSVEAEIVGEPNDDADLLFSNILKSVEYVGDKKKIAGANEAKKDDDKKEEKPDATAN